MRCPCCDASVPGEIKTGDRCPTCGGDLERAFPSTMAISQLPTRDRPGQDRARPGQDRVRSEGKLSGSAPSSDSSIDGARFVAGTLIGERYRIVSRIGRGGMGEVYKAEDLKLGEPVALKFLPESLTHDGASLARFHKEVRLARQITHPNVCRVFDIGETEEGMSFLSMELIDGEDLASLLRRIGRLPSEKAVELARQICAGLAAAHQRQVLHRDLKPANVMIDGQGRAKITDFGLAGLARETAKADDILGTPAYMAPEQLVGGELTTTTDVYALGLVIYEMLTGQRVFSRNNVSDRLNRLNQVPLEIHVEDVSEDLERVLVRCLALEPADRPSSVFEVEAALAGGDPLAAAVRAGEMPSPEMVARSRREGALTPRHAGLLLALFMTSLLLSVLLSERTTDLGRAGLELSPVILADRAGRMAAELGWDDPGDRTWALTYDPELRDADSPFVFWYRQSPLPMVAEKRWTYRPTVNDPPLDLPGMVSLELDATGRLWRMRGLPPDRRLEDRRPEDGNPRPPPWPALLELADLPADLEPTQPRDIPKAYADERRAWSGRPGGVVTRVEAAAWRGLPVYFEVHRGPSREPFDPMDTRWWAMIGAVFLFLWIASLVILRRNLRQARGDTDGAQRLFLLSVTASLVAWVLGARHMMGGGELQLFFARLASALMSGSILWLLYMALEPTVRRRWPDLLVSWSRLLGGRFRDPLVGRHLLQGMTLFLLAHVLSLAGDAALLHFGASGPRTIQNPDAKLAGSWQALAFFIEQLWFPFLVALAALFVLVRLREVLRRDVLATVVLAVLLFAVANADPAVTPLAAAAWSATVAFAALRWGLVAVLGIGFMIELVVFCPMTTDLSLWYSSTTAIGVGTALALGMWSYRCSLGDGTD